MKPGTIIAERYRVERKLGAGGMSSVWVATDTKFDVMVALKVAWPKGLAYEEFEARFRREAMIGRLLGQHARGFVRVLDWGHAEGDALYLVMDLIESATDLDLVSGDPPERLGRLLQAARLVRDSHALGIVHRDVKPANFLLRPDGEVFLTDFGLAKVVGRDDDVTPASPQLSNLTQSGLAMGTPWYMAPEQFDAKRADARADIYSLGIMLYEALTGDLPFKPSLSELVDVHARIRDGKLAPRPSDRDPAVPRELDDVCARCLRYDAAERPDGREVVDAIERALLGHATIGPAPTPARRPSDRAPAVPPPSERVTRPPTVAPPAVIARGPQGTLRKAVGPSSLGAPIVPPRPGPARPASLGARPPGPAPAKARPGSADESNDELALFDYAQDSDDARPVTMTGADAAAHGDDDYAPTLKVRVARPAATGPAAPAGVRRSGAGEYTNERDGSTLMWVPAGSYMPRLPDGNDPNRTLNAVQVEGFFIGKHPVTWAQFRRFCEETRRPAPRPRVDVQADHPVHGVTWADARAYCAWAGLRLPTEAEWEYAATGEEPRKHPWGDEPPDAERCCFAGHPLWGRSSAPVGVFPRGASPFGVHDMAGNVLEWLDDGRADSATRPLRGGSWRQDASALAARKKHLLPAEAREPHVGFRVARDLIAAPAGGKGKPKTPPAYPKAPPARAAAPRPSGPAAAAQASPSSSSSRPRRAADPHLAGAQRVLERIEQLLPASATAVSLDAKRLELRFTWGAERGVPLSLKIDETAPLPGDPPLRVAFIEQRLKLARTELRGAPTGVDNLLRGANSLARAGLPLRCVLGEDRLRYRREVFLEEATDEFDPIDAETLRAHVELLVGAWRDVLGPMRRVQEGEAWSAALRDVTKGASRETRNLERDLAHLLDPAWERMRVEGGLGVWPGTSLEAPPVVLSRRGADVLATRLLRPWDGTPEESQAMRAGAPAPRIDALLEELNGKNLGTPWTLYWDPARGVLGRVALGPNPTQNAVYCAIVLLEAGSRESGFETQAGW